MPANEEEFAPTTWGNKYETLEVPSGQRCLVQRLDLQMLIKNGTLNKLDTLTTLVDSKHVSKKAKGGKYSAKSQDMQNDVILRKIMNDPEKFAELMDTVDKIVISIVVLPELQPAPDSEADREEGVVYIDTVDLDDKMYLVNWSMGGTRDVARFRRELKQHIDDLADVKTVGDSAE